jgi:hypothetical protein
VNAMKSFEVQDVLELLRREIDRVGGSQSGLAAGSIFPGFLEPYWKRQVQSSGESKAEENHSVTMSISTSTQVALQMSYLCARYTCLKIAENRDR